jgi:hypothetical protein
MILITILALGVLTFVGKLIYDVQQNKKNPTKRTIESGFDVDALQKLAGIKPTNPNDELRQILVKNNIFDKEKIIEELVKAAENSEFPKPDESINVQTTKIGAIDMKSYGDNDPLAQIPMSRVSKEAKQKMAEIAKEDISKRLEETNKSIFPESVEYTDEYYKSTLPKKVKEKMLKAVPSENDQRIGVELVKPKRKTTNKNKNK